MSKVLLGRNRCRVTADIEDFFGTLGPRGDLGFKITIDEKGRYSHLFHRFKSKGKERVRPGSEFVAPTSIKMNIKGQTQTHGDVFVWGWLHNNHRKPCYMWFSLRTGKGFIEASFAD